MFGLKNLRSIVNQNRTFRRKNATKKWFLGVMIYIGSVDRVMGEKVKMIKIFVFNPSYTFRYGFQNLRLIVIRNGTFRRKKVTKKMVFGRKDLHRKCRLGNGRKSQNGQNSRV